MGASGDFPGKRKNKGLGFREAQSPKVILPYDSHSLAGITKIFFLRGLREQDLSFGSRVGIL